MALSLLLYYWQTKEYLHDAIRHQILNEDGLDGAIYDHLILDEYEDEPYFDLLCDVYRKAKHTYFQLGFDTRDIMVSTPLKSDGNQK